MTATRRSFSDMYKDRRITLRNVRLAGLPAIEASINGTPVWTYAGRDHEDVLERVRYDIDGCDVIPRACHDAHWYPEDDPRHAARLAHLAGEIRLGSDGTIPELWLAGWEACKRATKKRGRGAKPCATASK